MNFLRQRNKGKYVDVSDLNSRIEDLIQYRDAYPKAKNSDFQKSLDNHINIFKSKIDMFDSITVYWADSKRNNMDAIAEYYHSSSLNSCPVILLYEDTISNELKYDDITDIDHIIGTTIFHELGHAIVDIDNCYIFGTENILSFEDEEEYVENFCREFYDSKEISSDIIKLCNKFKKRQWLGIDPDYEINY